MEIGMRVNLSTPARNVMDTIKARLRCADSSSLHLRQLGLSSSLYPQVTGSFPMKIMAIMMAKGYHLMAKVYHLMAKGYHHGQTQGASEAVVRLILSYAITLPMREFHRRLAIPLAGLPESRRPAATSSKPPFRYPAEVVAIFQQPQWLG